MNERATLFDFLNGHDHLFAEVPAVESILAVVEAHHLLPPDISHHGGIDVLA